MVYIQHVFTLVKSVSILSKWSYKIILYLYSSAREQVKRVIKHYEYKIIFQDQVGYVLHNIYIMKEYENTDGGNRKWCPTERSGFS